MTSPPAGWWHPRRARRTSRRAVVMAAAAAGVLAVAGCHVPGGSNAGGPVVSATLTVSAPAGIADAPLYVGLKDGLFKDAGLTIRIRNYSTVKSAVAHLRSGSTDIAFGDYADMFYASEQHPAPNLSLVADGYDCGPNVVQILTLPNSPITSPKDLAGKTIGTPLSQEIPVSSTQPYSLETVAAWSALGNSNVPLTGAGAVRWLPMAANKLTSALQTRQVSAILVTEPMIVQAESQYGLVPVLDACSGATANLPLDGYFTTHSTAKHDAAALNAFRSALAKAQADASMAAPVQAALENSAGMNAQTAALVTVGTYPTSLAIGNIQRVASLMFFYNTLQSPLGVGQMVAK